MPTSKKVKPSLSNKLEYSKGLYKQFINQCSHRKIAAYGARHHERRSNGNLEGGGGRGDGDDDGGAGPRPALPSPYGVESVPKIEIFYEGEIFRDIPR